MVLAARTTHAQVIMIVASMTAVATAKEIELRGATIALDAKVILTPPCIIISVVILLQNIQDDVRMTLTSTPRPRAVGRAMDVGVTALTDT